MIDTSNLTIVDDGGGVIDMGFNIDETNHHCNARRVFGDSFEISQVLFLETQVHNSTGNPMEL